MMEYDLLRLFEHPLSFRFLIPSAIVILGNDHGNECLVRVDWRQSASDDSHQDKLLLSWNVSALRSKFTEIEEEISNIRERDEDRATQVEAAAVVVAVGVMAHIEPKTTFTQKSSTGTRHDYYLNDTRTEMIEIAGRWEHSGLPSLFGKKQKQSNQNPNLKKRWVSVTIFRKRARNRTEGLQT